MTSVGTVNYVDSHVSQSSVVLFSEHGFVPYVKGTAFHDFTT